jgi:hypothetical protein
MYALALIVRDLNTMAWTLGMIFGSQLNACYSYRFRDPLSLGSAYDIHKFLDFPALIALIA